MTAFFTQFELRSDKSTEDLMHMYIEWLSGMPHTQLSLPKFSGEREFRERIESQEENVDLVCVSNNNYSISACRYVYTDSDNVRWVTESVGSKSSSNFLFSIRVKNDIESVSPYIASPKKPYILKQIVQNGISGMDDIFRVTDKIHILDEDDIHIATDIFGGSTKNRLPIVYICYSGVYKSGNNYVYRVLPALLGGMAHVVMEPSYGFTQSLRRRFKHREIKNGCIYICWPEYGGFNEINFPIDRVEQKETIETIRQQIYSALSNQRVEPICDWLFVKEVISAREIELLKRDRNASVDEYINAFDRELNLKQEQLESAEAEIAKLRGLQQRKSQRYDQDSGLLKRGAEIDLYDHEIKSTLIAALRAGKATFSEIGRRSAIVEDIIRANQGPDSSIEIEKVIKETLRNYNGMDHRARSELVSIGFSMSEEGKHWKLVYQDDQRYTFILPKTPSDHRSGLNSASDISKKLFG